MPHDEKARRRVEQELMGDAIEAEKIGGIGRFRELDRLVGGGDPARTFSLERERRKALAESAPRVEQAGTIDEALGIANRGIEARVQMTRALSAALGAGANLVGDEATRIASRVPASRGFVRAGVRIVAGPMNGRSAQNLHGLSTAKGTATAGADVGDGGTVPDLSATLASAGIRDHVVAPEWIAARFDVSLQLAHQSEALAMVEQRGVDALLEVLESRIAAALDGETDVASVAGGSAAPTLAKTAELLASPLCDAGEVRLVMANKAWERLLTTPVAASSDRFLAHGDRALGRPIHLSDSIPLTLPAGGSDPTRETGIYAGDFANGVEIVEWGAPTMILNPYTRADEGIYRVTFGGFYGVYIPRAERIARYAAVKVID